MVYSGLIKQAAAHRSRNGRGSMIPTATMAAMAAVLLLTVVLPIGVILFLRKHGGSWGAFFTGAGTFVLFALILEPVLHNLVLGSAAGAAIQENILLYGLYGGLAAGVFEETGRLMAFRFVLKKQGKRITALSYGIGHGGIEAFLLVGLTMAANLALALSAGNAALPTEAAAAVETLASTPAAMFLWSGLERISAIALHIGVCQPAGRETLAVPCRDPGPWGGKLRGNGFQCLPARGGYRGNRVGSDGGGGILGGTNL